MVTRVLSIVRSADPGAPHTADPALDLNAYAVAEDVELTLALRGQGVEVALADVHYRPGPVAGVDVPAASPGSDLLALLASGVRVVVVAEDLGARGLEAADLVDGVEVVPEDALAALLTEHEVTLSTCTR